MNQKTIDALLSELQSRVELGVRFSLVKKNNNLVLHGFSFDIENSCLKPTLYLENYVSADTEIDIPTVADRMVSDFKELEVPMELNFIIEWFKDYELIKDMLGVRLINYDMNQDKLATMPHIRFLDLAIVLVAHVSEDASLLVNYDLFDKWGVSEEEVFKLAVNNTMANYGVFGTDMGNIIFGNAFEEEVEFEKGSVVLAPFESPMYVLSNHRKHYGASVILCGTVLKKLSAMADDDLIIIPSSVHEVILLPYNELPFGFEEVKQMVNEVNGSVVAEDEVLSNSVYLYRREDEEVVLVG